jgi:hypothetical protein
LAILKAFEYTKSSKAEEKNSSSLYKQQNNTPNAAEPEEQCTLLREN